jgi:hypothetical protein
MREAPALEEQRQKDVYTDEASYVDIWYDIRKSTVP